MKELWERIARLEHTRGALRQALSAIRLDLLAQVERIDTFLDCTLPGAACGEDDRADSDPRKKENT